MQEATNVKAQLKNVRNHFDLNILIFSKVLVLFDSSPIIRCRIGLTPVIVVASPVVGKEESNHPRLVAYELVGSDRLQRWDFQQMNSLLLREAIDLAQT